MYQKIEIPQEYKNAMAMAEKNIMLAKSNLNQEELALKNIVLELHAELGKSTKEWSLLLQDREIYLVNVEEYRKYEEESKKTKDNIVDIKEITKEVSA